jgi:hypothetical protein
MNLFHTLRQPEARSLAIALCFYLLAIFSEVWGSAWVDALPENFLFQALFGLAVMFQTDALVRWQLRGKEGFDEPNHAAVFVLTFFGGGGLLAAAYLSPEFGTGSIVTLAACFGVAVLVPGLKGRLLGPDGDERYRQSQLRAREAGLHALTVLGALFILADLSGLVVIPLWLAVGGLLWGVASTVTGVMWWQERGTDE